MILQLSRCLVERRNILQPEINLLKGPGGRRSSNGCNPVASLQMVGQTGRCGYQVVAGRDPASEYGTERYVRTNLKIIAPRCNILNYLWYVLRMSQT